VPTLDNLHAPAARLAILSLAAIALTSLEGCTVIGYGVGAATPRYEPVALGSAQSIASGTDVDIEMASVSEVITTDGYVARTPKTFVGQARGVERGDFLFSSLATGVSRIPMTDIRELRVKSHGNYSTEGLVVGMLVDVAVVAGLIVAVSNYHPVLLSQPLFAIHE
jgi:hypothetical protein